jgi:hypothetical protein
MAVLLAVAVAAMEAQQLVQIQDLVVVVEMATQRGGVTELLVL